MGPDCASLLADLFLYSYEAEFIQNIPKSGNKKLAKQFNLTFKQIECVALNNFKFSDSIDLIYELELDIKDTRNSTNSASYLDFQLKCDNQGNLHTRCMTNVMECIFHNLFVILEAAHIIIMMYKSELP